MGQKAVQSDMLSKNSGTGFHVDKKIIKTKSRLALTACGCTPTLLGMLGCAGQRDTVSHTTPE